jgi:ribonuclease HI
LGFGKVTNNFVETYALWLGIKLAKEYGLQKLVIVGYSMIVIKALINCYDPNMKDLPRNLSRVHSAMARFAKFRDFQILRELNSFTDGLEKQGSTLGAGEIVINGRMDFLFIT